MRHLLFLFFFFSTLVGNAQSEKWKRHRDSLLSIATSEQSTDSLKSRLYGTLYEMTFYRDAELANDYANEELKFAKRADFKPAIGAANMHIADYLKDRGLIDSARYHYDKSYKSFKEAEFFKGLIFITHSRASFEHELGNSDEAEAMIEDLISLYKSRDSLDPVVNNAFLKIGAEYELLGIIQKSQGNYEVGIQNTLKALSHFEQNKDSIRIGDAYLQLSRLEFELSNNEQAIDYASKASDIYELFEDLGYQSQALTVISDSFIKLNQLDKAQEYSQQALELAKQSGVQQLIADCFLNLGTINQQNNNYEDALSNYENAIEIYRKIEQDQSLSSALLTLADLYLNNNEPRKSLSSANQAIDVIEDQNYKPLLSKAYSIRSLSFEMIGNYSAALESERLHKIYQDSIFNEAKSQQIEELRQEFQAEKREQQIKIQDTEIQLLEERRRVSRIKQFLLLLAIIMVALISGVIIYRYSQRVKRNAAEKKRLSEELKMNQKQLTSQALHLVKKNELLQSLKMGASELRDNGDYTTYQNIISGINLDAMDDANWDSFMLYFEKVHDQFLEDVLAAFPDLSKNEMRHMALLKMNLSTKEIATILNISYAGVKKARQRLRKKLNLASSDSLEQFVSSL